MDFRGFSRKSGIFQIFEKKGSFYKIHKSEKNRGFSYYAGKGSVLKYLKFINDFERKLLHLLRLLYFALDPR